MAGADGEFATYIGSVRLTREGEVRWTTFSIFASQPRWRSEGIQLGGLRSSKVIGNWFDKYVLPFAVRTSRHHCLHRWLCSDTCI